MRRCVSGGSMGFAKAWMISVTGSVLHRVSRAASEVQSISSEQRSSSGREGCSLQGSRDLKHAKKTGQESIRMNNAVKSWMLPTSGDSKRTRLRGHSINPVHLRTEKDPTGGW